ncbi:ABC transporter substrate-binding protein (plasmid) [Paroceanicella profunda]|uniref:ABC transporter substrate-binding protein n=1 Tax=Paroceanicella profunda TaxID=2579971 RepID=A0A5B8G1T0_9RHOB|nr:ABC transporter substrate-binding protein [Paroceanicella profunda]QDL94625.1 ABC transporter substrate-binding protein [Paroceanicella profunda]
MERTFDLDRRTLFKGIGAVASLGAFGLSTRAALAQTTTLRAAITGYNVINTLDPAKASLIPEFYVIWSVFNGLLAFDETMKIVPDLAESYHALEDGGLEFRLREGVTFHDGSALTSEDVKFSIERLLDPDTASPNAGKVGQVDRVEVVDPLTLRIYTKEPFAPLLTFLTNARTGTQIVSKSAFEAMGAEAFGRAPVGTGPYKIASWDSGTGLKLTAHDGYFGGPGSFTDVEVPLITEEASGVTALKGGQIDMTSTAPAADVEQLMKDPTIQVARQPGLNTRFISLNLTKPPFDDVHFRRAVSMAFQREAMVKAVIFGEGVPGNGVIPPLLGDYHNPAPRDVTSFNPEAAKAELAQSKYAADAHPVTVVTWGGGWWKRMAEIFAAQVNQVLGTSFTVEVTDSNAAYSRQKSGDFTASVWGWLGMVDPDEYMGDIFHTDGWRNFGRYSNPEADALIEAGRAEMDPARRAEIYREVETMVLADAPVVPCFFSNIHNLLRADLQGFRQKPYSNFGDQFHDMHMG